MSTTILIASTSATVQKMVAISLANLPCQLMVCDEQQALAIRLDQIKPHILIASETFLTEAVVAQLRKAAIGVIVLSRNASSMRIDGVAHFRSVQQPFHSQRLVVAVCEITDLPLPHQALYAPYMMDIPLVGLPTSPSSDAPSTHRVEPSVATQVSERTIAELSAQADNVIQPVPMTDQAQSTHQMAQNENASNHTVDNSDGVVESRLAVDDTRTDLPQRFIGASNSDVFDSAVTAVDESTLDGESESGQSFIDQTEHSAITERVAQRMTDTLTMETARHNIPRDLVERVVWEVVPELAEALIKEEIARHFANQSLRS